MVNRYWLYKLWSLQYYELYMNRSLLLIILTLSCLSLFAQDRVNCESTPTWVENFNHGTKGLEAKWNLVKGWGQAKQETAKYDVNVKHGKLYITLKEINDTTANPSMNVFNKKEFGMKYGRVEVRAKCPAAKGVWPAIWLRPTRGINPKVAGEVDIMEWISCFDKDRVQPNFHLWGDFNGKKNNHTQYPIKNQQHFDVTKWHVYSAEWDKTQLIVRVDGQAIATWYAKDYPVWPFDYTYELLMDIAYGGWGATCGFDLSTLPQTMQVDWVKYYSLKK